MNQHRYGHGLLFIVFVLYVSSASAIIILDLNDDAPEFEKYTIRPVDSVVFGERVPALTSEQIEATPQSLVQVSLGMYTSMLYPTLDCMLRQKEVLREGMIAHHPSDAIINHPSMDADSLQKLCVDYATTHQTSYAAMQKLSRAMNRLTENTYTLLQQGIDSAKESLMFLLVKREQVWTKLFSWFGKPNEIKKHEHQIEYLSKALIHFHITQEEKNNGNARFSFETATAMAVVAKAVNCDGIDYKKYAESMKDLKVSEVEASVAEQDIVECYAWSNGARKWFEKNPPRSTIKYCTTSKAGVVQHSSVGIGGTIGSVLYDHGHWGRMHGYNWIRFNQNKRVQPVYHPSSMQGMGPTYRTKFGPLYREMLSIDERSPGSLYPEYSYTKNDSRYKDGHEERVYLMFPNQSDYDETEKGHGTTWVTKKEATAIFQKDNQAFGL